MSAKRRRRPRWQQIDTTVSQNWRLGRLYPCPGDAVHRVFPFVEGIRRGKIKRRFERCHNNQDDQDSAMH